MRVRAGVILFAVAALAACSDVAGPVSRQKSPPAAARPQTAIDALFAAAHVNVPIDQAGGWAIEIPQASFTQDSAVVVYYSKRVERGYLFLRDAGEGGPWVRVARLWNKPVPPPRSRAGSPERRRTLPQSSSGHYIGILKDSVSIVRDTWYVNTAVNTPGNVQQSEQYVKDLPYTAEFYSQTYSLNDTIYKATLNASSYWRGERLTSPLAGDTTKCLDYPTCDLAPWTYNKKGNDTTFTAGSQQVDLQYYLEVVGPVHVTLAGNDSIPLLNKYYTWTASASGGDGLGFHYAWSEEDSTAGTSWSSVGSNSADYAQEFAPGDRDHVFFLRVIASSGSDGATRSDTASERVHVSPAAEAQVYAHVSGDSVIQTAGTYTWTGSGTGGKTPYTYEWVDCENGCQTVDTTSTYTRYVDPATDGNFTGPQLTVYSNDYTTTGNKGSTTYSVYVVPPGGGYKPKKLGGGG